MNIPLGLLSDLPIPCLVIDGPAVDPAIQVLTLSDEHARISVGPGASVDVGDTAMLVPAHIDPAINLHDAMFVWDGGNRMDRWAVDGPRKL